MTPHLEHDAVQPDLAQLRELTELGRAFTYAASLDQVAQLAVERGARIVGAQAGLLMLRGVDDLMYVRAVVGIEEVQVTRFRAPLADDLMIRLQGLLGATGERFLGVPLVVGGAVTGFIAVALPHSATPADEFLLSALGDQTAVALENARLTGEVRLEMEDRLRISAGATSVKDRALATLAHDVRSPLGAIDGYCSNMEDMLYGPVTAQQRKALGRIRMSAHHLLSLLDSVLDMARLNAGPVPIVLASVDLVAIAQDAVDIVTPAAAAKLQSLQTFESLPVVVLGNADRIRQVLVNVLGNAVKFTPANGSVTVTVSRHVRDGGGAGSVAVADTGPGIPPAERSSIFEAYYRGGGAAHAPGVGLGLAISSALVAQMGGALAVESEVGRGSTFILRFPLAEPASQHDAPAASRS